MRKRTLLSLLFTSMLILVIAGCGEGKNEQSTSAKDTKELRHIKVALDWTPNTNHTGLYVAIDQGYYTEEGLSIEIIPPGAGGADTMVASGAVPFGISYQEGVTVARTQDVPLVSIAAVIQHNTSGFAAPVDRNIKTPKDFENKNYGGWGSPIEEAVMGSIMKTNNADYDKVKMVNMGDADYFTAVKRDIDFAWIFYAWTGIEAELRNEPLDMLYVKDYATELDYYTPVIVTNEKQIQDEPELVKAFLKATSKGYQYAIDKPEEAAEILIKAVPDLDKELVIASQKWLSPRYTDDAPRWGEQKPKVWSGYTDWLLSLDLLEKEIDITKAYTNEFLPN
ncbi:ABC transporter substrate-binding protein [Paenibacillus sp. CMAA1364]